MSDTHSSPARENSDTQFVSFWVHDYLLGIPVSAVQEVLNPQHIARTPRARPEIAGLLNLRGQIVTAVNLRRRLGLPERDGDVRPMNVVVRHASESYSILVDDVGEVVDVSNQQMDSPPPNLDPTWRAVTKGVFRLEDRLMVVVNVGAVLNLGA